MSNRQSQSQAGAFARPAIAVARFQDARHFMFPGFRGCGCRPGQLDRSDEPNSAESFSNDRYHYRGTAVLHSRIWKADMSSSHRDYHIKSPGAKGDQDQDCNNYIDLL
jgi:hypothetical protein